MTSLVTEQVYRRRTADFEADQLDVLDALDDAQADLEERLGRPLTYGVYTETRQVFPGFRVYPRVTPLDPASAGYFDEATLIATPMTGIVWSESFGRAPVRSAVVTYTGGWTAETLPRRLRDAICYLAQDALQAASAGGDDAAGLSSLQVQDLKMTFAEPTTGWRSGLWDTVKSYAHREVVLT